jgi:hypothetical protein
MTWSRHPGALSPDNGSSRPPRRGGRHRGRGLLISGITVIVAMCGMFLTGFSVFTGMGMATILVAVVGSLTVLPALMSWLGDRDRERIGETGH